MSAPNLSKLYSIQRDIFENPCQFRNSKELLDFLLCEEFHSTSTTLSSDVKLSWLSTWRTILDGQHRRDSLNQESLGRLLNYVKAYVIPSEDKYVVYSAQKLYVTVIQHFSLEEGIAYIAEVLETVSCYKKLCIFLEMCRDLLSKRNSNCCSFSPKLERSLVRVGYFCLTNICQGSDNQCLFQLFSVYFKIAKLANLYDNQVSFCSVQELLTNHGRVLVDILLMMENIEYFIKRKLINFLYYALVNLTSSCQNNSLNVSMSELALYAMAKFDTVDLKTVFLASGKHCFTGIEMCDRQAGFDSIHIREWTSLYLAMTAVICKGKQDAKVRMALEILYKVDACIQNELVEQTNPIMFLWLPRVYSDQDDTWIEAMLLLMDIAPCDNCSQESPGHWKVLHHLYFLQFIQTTCYDHLVVIDLLTSPETRFLGYLTCYLKHLLNTWQQFIESVEQFESTLKYDLNADDSVADNIKKSVNAGDSVIDNMKTIVNSGEQLEGTTQFELDAGDSVTNTANNSVSKSKNLNEKCVDNDQQYKETSQSENKNNNKLSEATSVSSAGTNKMLSVQPFAGINSSKPSGIHNACGNEDKSQIESNETKIEIHHLCNASRSKSLGVSQTRALAMIMDTYTDSEDEMETDVEDMAEGCSDSKVAMDDKHTMTDYFGLNDDVGTVNEVANVIADVNDKENGHLKDGDWYINNATKCVKEDAHCSDVMDVGVDVEHELEDADLGKDICDRVFEAESVSDIISETDNDIDDTECQEDSVMDKVMGMLIRARLKLERLWNSQVIQYNPEALLKLLEAVEYKYEEAV